MSLLHTHYRTKRIAMKVSKIIKVKRGEGRQKNILLWKENLIFWHLFLHKTTNCIFFWLRHTQNIAYISTFMMGIFGKNLSSNKSHKKVVVWFLLLFYSNAKYHVLTKTKEALWFSALRKPIFFAKRICFCNCQRHKLTFCPEIDFFRSKLVHETTKSISLAKCRKQPEMTFEDVFDWLKAMKVF